MEGQTKDNSKECAKEVNDKLFRGMVNFCADMAKLAQENANQVPPNHPQVVTDTLRSSILFDVERTQDTLVGKMGLITGKGKGDQAIVYGPRIELGFSGTDSLGRSYDQPPYPFLVPAAEAMKDRAEDYFKK